MRKLLSLMLCALLYLATASQAAVPENWKRTAYAYEARRESLSTVLSSFAREFGLTLDMPAIDGVLDGRIRASSPQSFLDRLGQEYGFQWFVYNDTLYVSPTQKQTSARIEVSPEAVDDLQQALTDIGLLEPRFGWGVLSEEGAVLVRGPARYVQFIRDYSQRVEPQEKAERQDIVVLPLKYANAADRTIRYRDQQLNVAGVASILQELLESRSRGETINGIDVLKRQSVEGRAQGTSYNLGPNYGSLGGQTSGLDIGALEQGLDQVLGRSERKGRGERGGDGKERSKIRVSADVRNNAVLIYDLPKRRTMYEQVVKQLDVPRKVIEIDAVILDIDRNELAELSSRWNFNAGNASGGANLFEPGTNSTLFIQDAGHFLAELRALEGNGAASIVSNPSILTLENQPAIIDFSRTEYLTALGERVANIEPITAGTSLQVIPRSLQKDGAHQVQLIVDIEDGQIDVSQINDEQPAVRKGNVSTQAVIAERSSLVIGGFHGLEANERVHRVPLLSRIPVIGKILFQSRSREYSQRERLFILTPRLIGDQVDPVRYVQHGNRHDLDEQMGEIAKRRDGADQPTRGDIQRVFTELLDGVAPFGVDLTVPMPFEPDSLCDPAPGLVLNRGRAQWFASGEWGVAVVLVRNTTSQPLRVDESRCGGRWVMGVAAWPQAWLQPGAESEVFIALRRPRQSLERAVRTRPSLLQRATP